MSGFVELKQWAQQFYLKTTQVLQTVMTRSPYRGVVWARSWSSFVSDSSCVGLLVQGKEDIAQRTFTKQRRAGLDKREWYATWRGKQYHRFCLAIGKVGGKEGCAFRYSFFEFILGFWACLQTGVNVILLVPGTNPFRSVYQTIDSPSVPTMQHTIIKLSHSEASCSDIETIEEMVVFVAWIPFQFGSLLVAVMALVL